ncbi:anti-sigma regulatory factor [Achromobacter sp. GG226]|uniref:anti-sigma regulatory factor n=1 Tax=Verticiella alkaliphila TaxID=2779529 RepID=UPI001C0B04AD|nr:anti-sigma regulatory factor [Verticiella sp. GG226]MBU4610872.1 anti-sigma regulatory factor [Verticiella sp. GG226]
MTGQPGSSAVIAPLRDQDDVVRLRQTVRKLASQVGLSLVDLTKIVTAASELARNTVVYGGGGHAELELVNAPRHGLRLSFVDEGPGIVDVERALAGGNSTGNGLGLGLSGSRRLADEFDLQTAPGKGTRVTVVKWKP